MSQQIVFDYLKTHPNKWIDQVKLSKKVGLSISSVTQNVKRLAKNDRLILKRASLGGIRTSGVELMYAKEFDEE